MEANFQGDLADIVRASRGGAVAAADGYHKYFSENSDRFQPLDPARDDGFGDLFPTVTDPFLFELEGIGPSFTPTSGMLETAPSQISSDTAELVSDGCAFAQKPTCDLQGLGGVISRDQGVISSINYGSSHKASSLIETARGKICSPRNWTTNKRKSLAKKVVCIPAPAAANSRQGGGEVVPSDLWAWRKYGQKPIKGSPYPRGYYRCSSSKGCPARKQVERSRTDPNMLVITYTSEHNHPWPTQRNSFAGSTRIPSKPETQKTTTMKEVEANNHHDTASSIKGHKNDQKEDANKGLNRIPSDYDLISDLRDLEAHPLNTLFNPSGFTGESDEDVSGGSKSKSMLDPFGSLFDWP